MIRTPQRAPARTPTDADVGLIAAASTAELVNASSTRAPSYKRWSPTPLAHICAPAAVASGPDTEVQVPLL